jgi:nitroreductase
MNVKDALSQRQSVRAFLDKPVSVETIRRILDAARHAPSGANTQPWQVAVVSGKRKLHMQQLLENEFRNGIKPAMDYHYYPTQWKDPYKARRIACGLQLYKTLSIAKEDKQRRDDQWAANYRAFDAPVVLFFFLDPGLEAGSFLDCGMFIQSIMLVAVEEGLAACPQAALGEYPQLVKQELGYPADSILLCGMALGYKDDNALVNSYRTPREAVETFTRFYE